MSVSENSVLDTVDQDALVEPPLKSYADVFVTGIKTFREYNFLHDDDIAAALMDKKDAGLMTKAEVIRAFNQLNVSRTNQI